MDNTRCNTQNRWRSVDAHFQTGDVTMSRSLLFITADNKFIMSIYRSRALEIHKMQHPKSVTLCWHSVDAHFQIGAVTMFLSPLPITAANTLIMDKTMEITSQLTYLQDEKSLMLH